MAYRHDSGNGEEEKQAPIFSDPGEGRRGREKKGGGFTYLLISTCEEKEKEEKK